MVSLYNFVTDRIEELKYNTTVINEVPDFVKKIAKYKAEMEAKQIAEEEAKRYCPNC